MIYYHYKKLSQIRFDEPIYFMKNVHMFFVHGENIIKDIKFSILYHEIFFDKLYLQLINNFNRYFKWIMGVFNLDLNRYRMCF